MLADVCSRGILLKSRAAPRFVRAVMSQQYLSPNHAGMLWLLSVRFVLKRVSRLSQDAEVEAACARN
jgi:hypothetical protein